MKRLAPLLAAFGLLAMVSFFGWALWATRDFGSWTGGSWVLTAMIVGGVAVTGALAAALMGLAFYSARKGYDERADQERRSHGGF